MRLILTAICTILLSANNAYSQEPAEFVPANNNFVIASFDPKQAPQHIDEIPEQQSDDSLARIAFLLNNAKYVGNSQFYDKANSLLDTVEATGAKAAQVMYYQAIIKQHFHEFDDSLAILDKVIVIDPSNNNARLLKANLLAIKGDFAKAKQACSSLVGAAEPIVVAACKLNTDAQAGSDEQIEKALAELTKFNERFPSSSPETASYIAEIQASMAVYIKQYSQANDILTPFTHTKQTVSFWVLYSDVHLALGEPNKVLSTLSSIVDLSETKDDALLLRLAMAEKVRNVNPAKWEEQIRQRVKLRILRQDEEHAFDIALYYMHIEKQMDKAYEWAKINWQQAKLQEDSALLSKAKQLAMDESQ